MEIDKNVKNRILKNPRCTGIWPDGYFQLPKGDMVSASSTKAGCYTRRP